jgi:hypothetical protein
MKANLVTCCRILEQAVHSNEIATETRACTPVVDSLPYDILYSASWSFCEELHDEYSVFCELVPSRPEEATRV